MANPSFLFRVDASLLIGAGHVMRCLTLADRLRVEGADCSFVCREHVGHLCDLIEGRGYTVHRLPVGESLSTHRGADVLRSDYGGWLGTSEEEDAALTAGLIAPDTPLDWIVVDHYALGARWERALRLSCRKMFAIDDLANRAHDCDVLLDQNLGRSSSDYADLVPPHCQRLIGPEYALLRPEFAALRAASLARRTDGQCRDILVTMGGVDADNVTGSALTALDSAALPADTRVTVVLGASAPWIEAVQTQARGMRLKTKIIVSVNNMAELMRDADLALGAAGSTAWERCCMGLPTMQVALADNQRHIAKALTDHGAAVWVERHHWANAVGTACATLLIRPEAMIAMSKAAAAVTDGLGANRVARSLSRGVVT